MSGFIGADPEELRNLAKHMDNSAEQLDGTRADLLSNFQRVRWVGEDANRAKGEFRASHAKKIQQATSMLRETADLVRKQAQEQTQASSSGSAFPIGMVIAKPLPAFIPSPDQVPPPNLVTLPDKLPVGFTSPDWFEAPDLEAPYPVYEAYTGPEAP